ncbi:hypothetical protein HMPREF1142_1197 [Peptostreptococcaceae bacterium AS15]|nr:hypothetical protein HMPREF1142_1197 [Peptostreptococcaceae bacterium AS15]
MRFYYKSGFFISISKSFRVSRKSYNGKSYLKYAIILQI